MKKQIKKLLGIKQRLPEEWAILDPVAYTEAKQTVLDLGCFRGFFVQEWVKVCPNATIHAFEPAPDTFSKLVERWGEDARIRLVQAGIGAEQGEIEFNSSAEKGYFNSFLNVDDEALKRVNFSVNDMKKIKVPVTTLDTYVTEQNIQKIDLIKVDVQGFELNVLRGAAEKTLPMTDFWLIESGIERLYEGAPRFTEVIDFMMDRGFHVMALRAYHRGNNVLVETDVLFRRDGLEGENNNDSEKFYSQIG